MFTGIITDIGNIENIIPKENGKVFVIGTSYDTSGIDIGASIACAGVCLTVTEKTENSFKVEASDETLSKTTIGAWEVGGKINLERAMKVGDELGGHIVSGHVDDVGAVAKIEELDDNRKITFFASDDIMKFIAEKGSVTIDGVSLTVNGLEGKKFWVNLIPHTLQNTTLGDLSEGDKVNLEIDTVARYTARLLENNSLTT